MPKGISICIHMIVVNIISLLIQKLYMCKQLVANCHEPLIQLNINNQAGGVSGYISGYM